MANKVTTHQQHIPPLSLREELEGARAEYLKNWGDSELHVLKNGSAERGAVLVEVSGSGRMVTVGWTAIWVHSRSMQERPATNPKGWKPGTCAVGPDGLLWIATGGNAYDGATRWISPDVEMPFDLQTVSHCLGGASA